MSSTQIINAAPMAVLLGIQDDSTVAQAVTPEQIPTHCAKVYLYTQKGPTAPQLVGGAGLTQMFGADTFDLRKPWANHATVLANTLAGKANAQMIERLVPTDAPQKANFTLWLDVLATPAVVYQRNSDGTYLLNNITGQPIPVSPAQTVIGYKCKWVVDSITTGLATDADSLHFGNLVSKVGDQTDGNGGTSVRYPILQFYASFFGSAYNNAGFRLWAPTVNDDTPLNSAVLSALKAFPFRMAAITRVNAQSTATVKSMLTGDQQFEFSLMPAAINPLTDAQFSLGDVLPKAYAQLNVAGYDNLYADLGGLHIYQTYLTTLMGQFYAAEQAFTGVGSDFTASATDELWKFNPISGKSSLGAPYHSFVLNTTDANAVVLTESTNLWAAGGGDGTMNDTNFANLVTTAVSQYGDPLSELNDTALNVESIMYDTGFPLATKQAMCNFISQRKDTFLVLSTYTVGGPELSASDEAAIGATLRTQVSLYPESDYFGTPVCRALILPRYGSFTSSVYTGKLPITIELASKAAAMMGAGSGQWNKVYLFDKAPQSVLTLFSNLNVTWTPGTQRNKDWANGICYPLTYDRNSLFFPALRTAYTDDTSVLTSFFTVMACVECEKIGIAAWRSFSGESSLTEAQLVKSVNAYINGRVQGKFAGLVEVVPMTTITTSDEARGYSWTINMAIGANNMKTVATVAEQVYRMADLPSAAS